MTDLKARIIYLARFLLLTMLVFSMAKVAFMLCHATDNPFAPADMAEVIVHGLSLDMSMTLYFIIVPFLLTMASIWVLLPRWPLKAYYGLTAVTLSLAFVADTSLYTFWRFKLDAVCLQYLETPTEAMASVSVSYLLLRLLLIVVIAAVVYVAYDRLVGYPHGRHGRWSEALLYVAMMPLMVIGIRGGVGDATTNIGQVYYSQNEFLNHSAVNPLFCFFYSLDTQYDGFSGYDFFDDATCQQLTADVYTTESIDSDTLLTTPRPDVVIILLEGAGEEFAHVMPYLQQLKHEGVTFSRCYANSWRTDRRQVCVLSGYPSFPLVSVMKMPEKSRLLPSIAARLNAEGYATAYLYGGDANFTNMRSYLYSTGWSKLTDIADFPRSDRPAGGWGVRDDVTFRVLADDIISHSHLQAGSEASLSDAPHHLWGYSTLSSHEPWEVPYQKYDDEVLNSFAYLDHCIQDFVESLRSTPAWDNLLIILTSDHGINYKEIGFTTPLLKHHIPMLWIGGAVRGSRTVDALCNQSDLAATLLHQLGMPHDDFPFSRDVLSASYRHPVAVNNCNNAQWIIDSGGHVLYDFDTQRVVLSQGTDSVRLLRLSKAILQRTAKDFKNR